MFCHYLSLVTISIYDYVISMATVMRSISTQQKRGISQVAAGLGAQARSFSALEPASPALQGSKSWSTDTEVSIVMGVPQ